MTRLTRACLNNIRAMRCGQNGMAVRSGAQPISRRLRLVSRRPVCGSSRGSPGTPSHPHAAWRPCPHHAARDRVRGALASDGTTQTARRSAEQGPRLRGCDRGGVHRPGVECGMLARSRVAPTRKRAGTAPPSTGLLAATRRDGALSNSPGCCVPHGRQTPRRREAPACGAHFVVATLYNTRGIVAGSLLELHPTLPRRTRGYY